MTASVEAAVRAELQASDQAQSALGMAALVLARTLDEGAGSQTAQVAKELRVYMKELTPNVGGDDFFRLWSELSAASVRDASSP